MFMTRQGSCSRVLLSATQIQERVRALGARITEDYRDRSLVVLAVLKGSCVFASDLIREIDLPLRVEFLGVASYGDGTRTTGIVQITQDLTAPIVGDDVLVVEDIVDTGLTLRYLLQLLELRGPRTLNVCALLHKPDRTREPIDIDYVGFTINDEFVVGYGLDYRQLYRNLPYVGVLDDG